MCTRRRVGRNANFCTSKLEHNLHFRDCVQVERSEKYEKIFSPKKTQVLEIARGHTPLISLLPLGVKNYELQAQKTWEMIKVGAV
ncbi:hypothetical protein TKK_0015213 [Trichogramma kaykai]